MGAYIYCRHEAASLFCTDVFHSTFPPLLGICKSSSQRREFRIICNMNATTPSQGRARIAERSKFTEPKLLLSADNETRKDAVDVDTSEFQVVLTTSKDFGSGISDLNAGILLALIGEHGKCSVHRIPTLVSAETVNTGEQMQELSTTHYRFQRGSQDAVSFSGPDLGNLEAIWIAPEKGSWRIDNLIVRVVPCQFEKDGSKIVQDKILQYDFVCEEEVLGENDKNPAIELKPSRTREISYDDYILLDSKRTVNGLQTPLGQVRVEGMKEYEALKFSLLSYDAILVTVGSAIAAATGHNEVAEGYFVGGLLGFLYLFMLERAVDQLPAPSSSLLSVSNNKGFSGIEGIEGRSAIEDDGDVVDTSEKNRYQMVGNGFKAPLTKLSGILAVSVLIVKALHNAGNQAISKEMLFAGAAGFLMTKIATILASVSLKKGG